MLGPHERRTLFDALRPPVGYTVDRAVGTSFTLDLMTLLVAPLGFTFFDLRGRDGEGAPDPVALLEALRRHASRIHLFCQAGRIRVPQPDQKLLAWLEGSVIEARAPADGGLFHPKVWALRYLADDGPVVYRFVCLSRNLTEDLSWDTAVVLEGELVDRQKGFATNAPLSAFFATLPRLAVHPLAEETVAEIRRMSEELRRVRFEPPEGFEAMAFWPLGIEGHRKFPFPADERRLLVVSPFLSAGMIDRLATKQRELLLVSRQEVLDAIPDLWGRGVEEAYVLDPGAELDSREGTDEDAEQTTGTLTGLHAKLYVVDDGWNARLLTGSANATEAAFTRNVEFLVELRGRKRSCGIDAVLGSGDREEGFARLLVDYRPPAEPIEGDPEAEALERKLELARDLLTRSGPQAVVESLPEGLFKVTLSLTRQPGTAWPMGLSIRTWPATLPREGRRRLPTGASSEVAFETLSFEALTSFFCFALELRAAGGLTRAAEFTMNLPLSGAPEDRTQRLLTGFFSDSEKLLRFLLLLLAEDGNDPAVRVDPDAGLEDGSWGLQGGPGQALFETILRALVRSPERLDPVERLIRDLQSTPEGRRLLPPGLESIWGPIWEARRRLAEEAR